MAEGIAAAAALAAIDAGTRSKNVDSLERDRINQGKEHLRRRGISHMGNVLALGSPSKKKQTLTFWQDTPPLKGVARVMRRLICVVKKAATI